MTVFAALGANALWFMYGWLLSAIVGNYLSSRKGYGDRAGLASGLLVPVLAPLIWLVIPAKPESKWKRQGPWGRGEAAKAPSSPPDGAA